MRVRMRAELSGTRDGLPWPQKGQTVELPDEEAAHLVAAGLAESESGPEVEEATAPAPETSTPARRSSRVKSK
ncbi:hypothetical protein OHB04_22815 [Streptomyces sp. NBC_01775]|uniref:hypothetical protein n=1 Tax=Streptomyces sp. NBC_01775 TaxID=2975939 RepID=UPI002DDAB564|nr:hypothetical protein [Streptomyces sp. NBC_01775]WSB78327.1 hypothetical protein OHB04_22815 [Streptomyces sp. NBC_01775]